MQQSRRQLLRAVGLVAASAGIAGCNTSNSETTADAVTNTGTTASTETAASADDGGGASLSLGPEVATAAEWTAMRTRLDDAYALGLAGEPAAGAAVAQRVFQRFEGATGEYGAHEFLEETGEDYYEGFEDALGTLQASLSEGDVDAAEDAWANAGTNLRSAQLAVLGEDATYTMDVLRFGAAANNLAVLAATDADGASTAGEDLVSWFEDAAAHEALEEADHEAYEAFEGALEAATEAASSGDVEGARTAGDDALAAAVTGAHAMVDPDEAVGAGHLAAMQATGFDAAVLSSLGGPSTDYAHAAALTIYRARAHDAAWLSARGETEIAQTMAEDVFAHFEGARAHEALEEADHEAYEAFEGGLESLIDAIEAGDSSGIDDALSTVDSNLVTGIGELADETGAAVLEAGFFRSRLQDARELYRLGGTDEAAGIAESLFATFEADELGFHEVFEHADHEAYETFEDHLGAVRTAFADGDDSGVETHATGALDALLGFETTAGSTAQVSAAESAYMAARAFDAAALAALDQRSRAAAVVGSTFEHFEAGAGGFHEALEDADGETYEAFEATLGAIREAAEGDGDVYGATTTYNQNAVDAAYAVVENAGGASSGTAAALVSDTFAAFEEAEVHETLEDADHEAYERFEAELEALSAAVESGSDVRGAVRAFADATTRAQFAVVGALEEAPAGGSDGHSEEGESEEIDLQGGPNVVEGVPDDADHVVDMQAVAFEPEELTVSVGDTVAFAHRAGEPHSVTAREDGIPGDADYWASGGFDSESAANEGWENGQGAVQSGQSYVHTFQTAGEHAYYCIPHEMAGMEGTVVVEE